MDISQNFELIQYIPDNPLIKIQGLWLLWKNFSEERENAILHLSILLLLPSKNFLNLLQRELAEVSKVLDSLFFY